MCACVCVCVCVCVRHTLVFEVDAFETLEGAGVCVRVRACVKLCAIQMVHLRSYGDYLSISFY